VLLVQANRPADVTAFAKLSGRTCFPSCRYIAVAGRASAHRQGALNQFLDRPWTAGAAIRGSSAASPVEETIDFPLQSSPAGFHRNHPRRSRRPSHPILQVGDVFTGGEWHSETLMAEFRRFGVAQDLGRSDTRG
jgi:hypothetical protein